MEERHYFKKDWTRYATDRNKRELLELDKKIMAQQKALDELRHESLELYLEAVQIDPELVPYTVTGPTLTPAIKDYIQDGAYTDITRDYKVVYQDTESFLKQLLSRNRKKKKAKTDEED